MKIEVLDKGFIEVMDSLGNDLTVVNSARVSFGKRKEKWDKSDEGMLSMMSSMNQLFTENNLMIINKHLKVSLKVNLK